VLEAMACDRPVLCSNVTGLPEVAGNAAILFDPRSAPPITQAIERLESCPDLEPQLVQAGRARVAQFGDARAVAAKYLAAFEDVVSKRRLHEPTS
jgi:glycosyltransferase involved in cell wall biosynthesis